MDICCDNTEYHGREKQIYYQSICHDKTMNTNKHGKIIVITTKPV